MLGFVATACWPSRSLSTQQLRLPSPSCRQTSLRPAVPACLALRVAGIGTGSSVPIEAIPDPKRENRKMSKAQPGLLEISSRATPARHFSPTNARSYQMTSQTYATRRRRLVMEDSPQVERLLTPAEVAAMFRVDPKTVTRWAKAGKLSSIRTLGGHRRYREAEVRAFLAVGRVPASDLAQ